MKAIIFIKAFGYILIITGLGIFIEFPPITPSDVLAFALIFIGWELAQ